jgi:hypothetical protein
MLRITNNIPGLVAAGVPLDNARILAGRTVNRGFLVLEIFADGSRRVAVHDGATLVTAVLQPEYFEDSEDL